MIHNNGRRIALQGAYNFRDLGGYDTADGKSLKWGKIYRSDQLSSLTQADLLRIEQLEIKRIVDLRSTEEQVRFPSRLPKHNPPEVLHLELADKNTDYASMYKKMLSGKLGNVDVGEILAKEYEKYVTQYDDNLSQLFQLLVDGGNYPLLIHCTHGKDRTGVVSALILSALNVPRETILQDYLLSGVYLQQFVRRTLFMLKIISLFRINISQFRPIFEVREANLRRALSTIEKKHGSVEEYLQVLGVSNQARDQLREMLCE